MKKHLLTLALCLATAWTAQAQELYSTDFSSEEEFNKWVVVDANEDASTWTFSESATTSKVYYNYNGSNDGDDWLISPAITPSASGNVLVTFTATGSSYGESMEAWTGTGTTVTDMTTKHGSWDYDGSSSTHYFILSVEAGQPFHVGFHATSAKDHWRLYMQSFTVKSVDKAVDLAVDSLISPTTGNGLGEETVTVRVKNSGSDATDHFQVAYTVDGGTPVVESVNATLAAGETIEHTFAAKADLSEPRHTYTIKAYTIDENDIVTANDTLTASVRHMAPVTPPYTMGFEAKDYTSDFKFYNLNGDDGEWKVYTSYYWNMARTGYSCLAYNYDKNNAGDDWAMIDPITVEAGDYVLRYWYSGSDGHNERLAVYYGHGDTPDDMTTKIAEQSPITEGTYRESISILHFDEPQTIYIGFHAFSDKDENWLTIDDLEFYKATSDNVDIKVNSISRPFSFVREPNDKDVVYELRNVGIKDTEATVTLSIDGTAVSTSAISMKAQEIKTVTAEGVLEGLAEGAHTLLISATCEGDNHNENDTISLQFTVLGTPVLSYDFENATVPADFTFYTLDSGSVNASAGEEWNTDGWGIVNLQRHTMYGEHVLGATSWLDNTDKANRWVVLPQVTVGQDDAYFVWDASSGNDIFLETYKVCVSDSLVNPNDGWYSTSLTVSSESITPKTRGISLKKYAGKKVYVAINLCTAGGDFLVLDNLALYGVTNTATGISDISRDASADTPSAVYTIDGKRISSPQKGLNIVRQANGSVRKVIVR